MSSDLKSYLRKRWVRALLGGAVFVAVIYVQYRLADWPVAVDLAETGKFSPITLRLGQEELLIERPVVNSPEGVLLAHTGEPNEIVDIRFDNARLDPDTLEMLTDLGSNPPSAPAAIKFSPRELNVPNAGVGGDPCRTFVTAGWAKPDSPPAELKFFQLETPGLDRFRHLEMQVTGGELLVQILPKSGESDEGDDGGDAKVATGCRNLLRAGDMEETLGEVGVGAIAADGSAFRWHFRPRMRGVYLWSGADGLFQPFILGQPQVSAANAPPPLQARAVRVRSLEAGSGGAAASTQPDLLSAQSVDGAPLLSLSALKVGSDQLQINVTGNGWVRINGVDRSVNLFERLNDLSPLGALLFAALNGALFEGLRRFVFGTPKTPDPQPPADT